MENHARKGGKERLFFGAIADLDTCFARKYFACVTKKLSGLVETATGSLWLPCCKGPVHCHAHHVLLTSSFLLAVFINV